MCFCGCVFFKQKSAYEMRISDWSSDVCSSDLHRLEQAVFPAQGELVLVADIQLPLKHQLTGQRRHLDAANLIRCNRRADALTIELDQIARASCRERVCQSA